MSKTDVRNAQIKKVDELLTRQRQELLEMLSDVDKTDTHETRLTTIISNAYVDMGRSLDDIRRYSEQKERMNYYRDRD